MLSCCLSSTENPPPCNEFYLMTCSKGVCFVCRFCGFYWTIYKQAGVCKYSHDYILTPEQLVSLANNAKKAPCNWLKNGEYGQLLPRCTCKNLWLGQVCNALMAKNAAGVTFVPTVQNAFISAKANAGSKEVRNDVARKIVCFCWFFCWHRIYAHRILLIFGIHYINLF